MSADDKAYAFYMVLLLLAVCIWYFANKREKLSQTIQQLAVWALIFVGVITAYGFKDTFMSQIYPSRAIQHGDKSVTLSRARDGHFYAMLQINGKNVEFVVDTGATSILLSQKDAKHIGINPDELTYWGQAQTANGKVKTASVDLGIVHLGDITDYDLKALVNAGQLDESLLGMEYLNLFSEFKISGDTLTLVR